MLNGKFTLQRAENGWIIQLSDEDFEVYTEPEKCFCRVLELMEFPSISRMLLNWAESTESSGHIDPATDPDLAELAAPGTPATVPIGD